MGATGRRVREFLLGKPRDLNDPRLFHHVSLVTFLAWVGLGADGLSSSSYGPEEAFRALGGHHYLVVFVALATALSVLIISACYTQIISRFPAGGGGYLVATKLIGNRAGVVSGAALTVDYVLTIAISVASGCDALWSFLPAPLLFLKFPAEILVVLGLIVLNLRGARESVLALLPIFLVFVVTHVVMLGYVFLVHGGKLVGVVAEAPRDASNMAGELGWFAVLALFLRAYSLGGGTYTGIEAVSNAVPVMREPRVKTAQRTMGLMAVSLAITAGGIMIGYLLVGVEHVPGRTLNAVLADSLFDSWHPGGLPVGLWLAMITIFSEGALLFVAAQSGFLDGPRVLSNMALDSWVPHRLAQLSDRFVTRNGVWLMGLAAIAALVYTRGAVGLLVVMYSINVFLTFSLSMGGMCRYWIDRRRERQSWKRGLALHATGLTLCLFILVVTVFEKFSHGGWVTVLITSTVVAGCFWIRNHYRRVKQNLQRLDEILVDIPLPVHPEPVEPMRSEDPTAVLIVRDYDGLGMHSLLNIPRLFPGVFKNYLFVSVAVVDSGTFKGEEEVAALKAHAEDSLRKYVSWSRRAGLKADYRLVTAHEVVPALEPLCRDVARDFPRAVFFAGKLVFREENFMHGWLHNETPSAIQRALQFAGLQTVILPIRVT